MFKKEWLKPSDYPRNFIPNGAQIFIGVDHINQSGQKESCHATFGFTMNRL